MEKEKLIEKALLIACEYHEINPKDILKKHRSRVIVESRQIWWKLIKDHSPITITELGRISKLDHSTVLHGLRKMRNIYETEIAFRIWYNKASDRMNEAIKFQRRDQVEKLITEFMECFWIHPEKDLLNELSQKIEEIYR